MATKTVIPFGPQHPVLPEPIQLKLTLEDERVVDVLPAIGYVHRGVEKAAEINDYTQNVFLVERICGICSFIHALCYCQGIEKLMNIQVPDRARYLRVIFGELHRMHSHHLYLGLLADAFGFESLFMQTWRNREMIMDILEKTAGSRVIISVATIGGMRRDLSPDQTKEILEMLDVCQKRMDEVMPTLRNDYTIRGRTIGKGKLTSEQALNLGAVGPVMRGSGIAQDARMTGYAAYGDLGFEPVVEQGGDAYARTMVRAREIYQSMDLVRRAIQQMPEGEVLVKPRGAPKGQVMERVEQPRGECLYLIDGNGTRNLNRLRVRTPTFANVPPLVVMLPGNELADVPVVTLSIDPCISCTER